MYSDDSLEKLKENNSTRLASIKKIKDEMFVYGAKGSFALSGKFKYRKYIK